MWTDYKFTVPEDQTKFIVPLNRDTEHIFYNQRIIFDAKVLTEPRVWQISKVNRTDLNGLCLATMKQDIFDPNRDFIEKDEWGNVIGMWADWFNPLQYNVDPKDHVSESILPDYHLKIEFGGVKPVLKVRGSYKTFTAVFEDRLGNILDNITADSWTVSIDGEQVESDDNAIVIDVVNDNQIRLWTGADNLLGKVVSVSVSKDGLSDTKEIEIVGM